MTQRYRIADQVKVANELSGLLYEASEAVRLATQYETTEQGAQKLAKLRADLIGASAGALTHKPPAAVLATLVWVAQLAQERATGADFNTPQEALDEHDALAFVADWLAAHGQDVTELRGAQLSAAARAELVEQRDAMQAELDALEVSEETTAPDMVQFVIDAAGGAEQAARGLGYMIRVDRQEGAARYYAAPDLETPAVYGYHDSREAAARALVAELLRERAGK